MQHSCVTGFDVDICGGMRLMVAYSKYCNQNDIGDGKLVKSVNQFWPCAAWHFAMDYGVWLGE